MVQTASTVATSVASNISKIATKLCGARPTKPSILILDSEGMRGPPTSDLTRLENELTLGSFDKEVAIETLKKFKETPAKLHCDTWVLSGYLDPGLALTGTNMNHLLGGYVDDPSKIKIKTFGSAAVRNTSIEDCALDFIASLEETYQNVLSELITINLVSHSMGSAIAMTAIGILADLSSSKTYVVNNFISLNGAILGSPIAKLVYPIRLCFSKNVALDLRPSERRKALVVLGVNKATYFSSAFDNIVPTSYSAPPGYPVVVVRDINEYNTHVGILRYCVVHAYILKSISKNS